MRLIASLICGPRAVATLAELSKLGATPELLVTHGEHVPLAARLLGDVEPSRILDREVVRRGDLGPCRQPPVGDQIAGSSRYVLAGLAMLDRANWNGANLSDMFRLYLRYLTFWYDRVSATQPDVCWFDAVPHQAQDWALYQVCKENDVPTLVSCATVFDNSPVIYRDVTDVPVRVDQVGQVEPTAPVPRRAPTSTYLDSTVGELTDQAALGAQRGWAELYGGGLRRLVRTATGLPTRVPDLYPFLVPSWPRRVVSRTLMRLRDRQRIAKQARLLLRLPEGPPDDGRPRVFFPLHFQPEMTSVPLGMPHFDQLSAIRALAAELDGEAEVLVKEHPQMLRWTRGWSRARSQAFYEELAAIRGVALVSPAARVETLLAASAAVATLTGTIGYEARLHGVATLCFGAPWYQPLRGVYRVARRADLQGILSRLLGGQAQSPLSRDEIGSFVSRYTVSAAWGKSPTGENAVDFPRRYAQGLFPLLEAACTSAPVTTNATGEGGADTTVERSTAHAR